MLGPMAPIGASRRRAIELGHERRDERGDHREHQRRAGGVRPARPRSAGRAARSLRSWPAVASALAVGMPGERLGRIVDEDRQPHADDERGRRAS